MVQLRKDLELAVLKIFLEWQPRCIFLNTTMIPPDVMLLLILSILSFVSQALSFVTKPALHEILRSNRVLTRVSIYLSDRDLDHKELIRLAGYIIYLQQCYEWFRQTARPYHLGSRDTHRRAQDRLKWNPNHGPKLHSPEL